MPELPEASPETSLETEFAREDMRGSNQRGVRAHNERLALSLLRLRGPTAKAEIARLTGLSAQTISVIMRRLESEGLIERGDPVRGRIGQPSVPMRLARDGAFFFGVKIGRRSADVVLVDFLGNMIDRVHLTYRYPLPDGTISFIRDAVGQLNDQLPVQHRERLAGLGIAIPGYLWEWASDIGAPADEMAAWRDRDIGREVAELFDFPVYLRNDASCACGAELVLGRQVPTPHFLYFYVGLFIGGGVVLNNALFTGPTGNAGALGPLTVPTDTGELQQLVNVASLSGLEAAIMAAGGDPTTLWENSASWTVDPDILDGWLEQAAGGLAYAIAAACTVIDFEFVVIDGWLPDTVRASLVARAGESLNDINLSGIHVPELREGTVGADARALGAACIPLSKRFLVDSSAFTVAA